MDAKGEDNHHKGSNKSKKGQRFQKGSTKLIESSVIDYYRNINEQLAEGFNDEAHKELFLGNVFDQLEKDLLKVSRHQSTSFTLQKLIRLATADQLLQLLQAFCSNFNECMTDRSTTYVIQTALYNSTEFFNEDEDNPFTRLLHQFGMQLLERSDLITSSYASHVIRTLAEVMAGVKVNPSIIKGKHAKQVTDEMEKFTPHELFSEFQDLLTAIANQVIPVSSDTFNLIENTHTCALAETLLLIFREKSPAQCQSLCGAILASGNLEQLNDDGLPALLAGETSSYFVSALVKVLSKDELNGLLTHVVLPHIQALASHPQANFVVQDVIENLHSSEQLNAVLDHLEGQLSYLLSNDRGGVIVKMAVACQKLTICQARFNRILLTKVVRSKNPNGLFLGLAASISLTAEEDEMVGGLKNISYMRSLLLQKLFGFTDCYYLCEGLLTLSTKCILVLATNKFGSFVLEGFLKSNLIHPSKKKTFATTFQNIFPVMAKDKFGSRVFEAIWSIIPVPSQRQVASMLSGHNASLLQTPYGRAVAYNIHLSDYIHDRVVWDKWILDNNKQRKMANITEAKAWMKLKKDTITAGLAGLAEYADVEVEPVGEVSIIEDRSQRRKSKKKRKQERLAALAEREHEKNERSTLAPVKIQSETPKQEVNQVDLVSSSQQQDSNDTKLLTDKQRQRANMAADKITNKVRTLKKLEVDSLDEQSPVKMEISSQFLAEDRLSQKKSKKKNKQLKALANNEGKTNGNISIDVPAKKKRKTIKQQTCIDTKNMLASELHGPNSKKAPTTKSKITKKSKRSCEATQPDQASSSSDKPAIKMEVSNDSINNDSSQCGKLKKKRKQHLVAASGTDGNVSADVPIKKKRKPINKSPVKI